MSISAKCGRCGAPIEADAAFCKKCGLDVTQAYTPPPTQAPPPAAPASPSVLEGGAETVAMPPQGAETVAMPPQGDQTIAMPTGSETIAMPQGVSPTDATVVAGTPPPGVTTPGGAAAGATAATPGQPPRVQATMRQQLRDATIGEYEILSELGRGGMATVFLAHDISLDRKVAIKVMAPHLLEGDGMVERFKLEARTAAQLSHPHIIPIYAVKWTDTTIYFVMKFIEGRPLDDIIKKMAPLPVPMVKDILIKVGGALGYGHRREVVHRDIKPANIMIDEEGTPIVTDFGIAKVANEGGGLTMTGTTIGTPSYMSPEQCEAKEVSGASDQYSLGVLAWEMLTGKLPFEGQSAVSTMYMHCHEPLPPLLDFRPDCPAEVMETVERMLAKDPKDRWPSLEAAIQKLGTESTMSYMDPVHSELVELVKQGDHRELLARIQTPRSPIPVGRTGEATAAAPAQPKSKKGLAAAAVIAAVLGGSALAVLQPWAAAEGGDPVVEAPAQNQDPVAATDGSTDPAGGVAAGAVDGGADDEPIDAGSDEGTVVADNPPADPDPVVEDDPPPAETRPVVTVRSVSIDGAPGSITVGGSATLAAVVMGSNNQAMNRTPSWNSSEPGVLSVDGAGRVTAIRSGRATITASVDNRSATTTIEVTAVPVGSIRLSTSSLTLLAGNAEAVSATVLAGNGSALSGRVVDWTSSDNGVATVDGTGRITAVAPGRATVSAQSGGATGRVDVTVEIAPEDAVRAIIADYVRALESRDINNVRAVFPGIPADQAQQLADALGFMDQLDVTLNVEAFQQDGPDASQAIVTGTYDFVANGRQQAPVSFTAFFARQGGRWVMTRTQ